MQLSELRTVCDRLGTQGWFDGKECGVKGGTVVGHEVAVRVEEPARPCAL